MAPRAEPPITLRQAADALGVHYMTAYRYVRTGRLPAERDGAEWRVRPADVEALRNAAHASPVRGARAGARQRLERRLVAGDEAGSWSVVEAVLGAGASPSEIYLAVLGPAMRSIGERWQAGELDVADEHRATVVAERIVGRLGPRFARRGRKRGAVVLGAVAGETHALPGAMLADLLRGSGFDVVDLGVNTPPESFVVTAANASRLVAVVLGATGTDHEDALAEAVTGLHRGDVGVPVLVGGAGVDEETATRLGADGWSGFSGDVAVAAIEDAVGKGST